MSDLQILEIMEYYLKLQSTGEISDRDFVSKMYNLALDIEEKL